MSVLFDGCYTGQTTNTTVNPGPSENHSEKISGTKHDSGKLRLSRVPPQIITAIANVRDYGDRKYTDPENWRKIAPERWHEALLRHTLAIWTAAHRRGIGSAIYLASGVQCSIPVRLP